MVVEPELLVSYRIGVGPRPLCSCGNLVERRDEISYKRVCSTCRKKRVSRVKPPRSVWRLVKERGLCESCGYKQMFNGFLNAHHIDGDPGNNEIENLLLLCPNCHAIADYQLKQDA
jgi:hypothetical protein